MPEKLTVAQARREDAIGRDVLLQGWVRTRRDSKAGFSFIELNDGSSFGNIQVVAPGELDEYESVVKRLTAGCSVSVEGTVRESPGKGQATEVEASRVTLHGTADAETYPLQKKRHSFEFLRTIAHLRPRTNTFGAIARVRNCVCNSIHRFFQEEGFLYIHTPIITASDCEGAGELFRVTTLPVAGTSTPSKPTDGIGGNTSLKPTDGIGGTSSGTTSTGAAPPVPRDGARGLAGDFFERPTYLTVSGQLAAETFACGLGKVYTFGPTFRAENSNTSRHLAEFWMVEPEMAFCDLAGDMDLAERFLKRVFRDVLEHCPEDMDFFNLRIDKTAIDTLRGIVDAEFVRLPYTEAIAVLEKSGRDFEFPVRWGADLQSEHERYLTEEHFKRPVIVHDYPRTIKPFYMRLNDDPGRAGADDPGRAGADDPGRAGADDGDTVAAMDVLVPKVGEIIGGSQREERLDVLERRMAEQQLNIDDYWWYRDLRRYGTVPHAGFGLGLERCIQFITGMANIRDVIPFPRTPGNAEF